MPTYVYECKSCSAVFEADQSIKDDPLTTCIPCGAVGTVKRVIQPVGIAFKGSGFHINDYSSSPSKASESAKTETPESSDSKPAEAPKAAETPAAKPAESTPAST